MLVLFLSDVMALPKAQFCRGGTLAPHLFIIFKIHHIISYNGWHMIL
jgi:hypothetical protein